ncbi:MAG: chitosanase [Planctomycetes bacterium]|nr:chitosanase [Planctomycetota bacterium]
MVPLTELHRARLPVLGLFFLAAAGCNTGINVLPPGVNAAVNGLTVEQKLRAEQYTSIFENDTIVLQYAYVVALDDGRGYTAGRAGFTTATCDALEVIKRYTLFKPGNGLARFLPRLVELCDANSDSLVGLDGFPDAWAAAAVDSDFLGVQDDVVDDYYYRPALSHAVSVGLRSPLGVAALYDAIIQHGEGDDHDGLQAMIDRTSMRAGGTPATGVDEVKWLRFFWLCDGKPWQMPSIQRRATRGPNRSIAWMPW